jgi:hypothetical protein
MRILLRSRWKRIHHVWLGVVGLLVVVGVAYALAEHSPLGKSPSANAPVANGGRLPDPKAIGNANEQIRQMDQASFDAEFARLDVLVRSKDLQNFTTAAEEVERQWGHSGGQYYGRLMLEIANAFANYFEGKNVNQSSQIYASIALAKADTFSLRLETILLEFLNRDLGWSAQGPDTRDWQGQRAAKAKLWLHGWQRLEKGINRNFDLNERATLSVTPPEGLPPGADPDAVRDPHKRKQYIQARAAHLAKAEEFSRQFEFRALDGVFPKKAEKYLVRVYSEPPYNMDELERYLTEYNLDDFTKKRVLKAVVERIAQAKSN